MESSKPNSSITTGEFLLYAGTRPVFADVYVETFTIDSEEVKKNITPKAKAVLQVHKYGHPGDIDIITELAEENNLHVIEGVTHSLGACYKEKMLGSIVKIK